MHTVDFIHSNINKLSKWISNANYQVILSLWIFIAGVDYHLAILRAIISVTCYKKDWYSYWLFIVILKKARSRQYPAEAITDADSADDLVLLANTSAQAESLLHNLEQAARGIGLWIQIKQSWCVLIKMVLSPFEMVRLWKQCWLMNRLSIMEIKSLYKVRQEFFQAVVMSVLLYGCTTWNLTKCLEKKLSGNYIRMLHVVLNKFWKQHSNKTGVVWPLTSHLANHQSKTNKTCWVLL